MTTRTPLTSLFKAHLGQGVRDQVEPTSAWENRLERLVSEGRASWPRVNLPADRFIPFMAARVPEESSVAAWIESMNVKDLYLACACAQGNDEAVAVFKERFFPEIGHALLQLKQEASFVEDMKQLVYERLFIGSAEKPPKILYYLGAGQLSSWIKVVAFRVAVNSLRDQQKRFIHDDDALFHPERIAEDGEVKYLKGIYRNEFKAAFKQAFAKLAARERNVLRYQLIDGLNAAQIGLIYHVHRSTVTRWMEKIQHRLLTDTRYLLEKNLGVNQSDLDSIMRMIQSELSVSIEHALDDE
jgi:RNA polymerase sigma-70 factor, ECF subfamily